MDEGRPLGAGFQPPKAALVKSLGSERLRKVTALNRAGKTQREDEDCLL